MRWLAIDVASQMVPSMAAYRALIQRKPFELKFLTQAIDCLLLPALGIVPAVPPAPAKASKASKKVPGAYP